MDVDDGRKAASTLKKDAMEIDAATSEGEEQYPKAMRRAVWHGLQEQLRLHDEYNADFINNIEHTQKFYDDLTGKQAEDRLPREW